MTSLQNLIQVLPDEVPALTASSGMSSFRIKFCRTISSCDKRMIGSNRRAAYPSCPDPLASSLVTRDWKYDLSNYIFLLTFEEFPSNKHSPCLCSFSHSSSDEDDSEEEDQSHSEIASLKRLLGLVLSSMFVSSHLSSTFYQTYLHYNCQK